MTEQLKNKLLSIPEEPGIYKFLNEKGNIIYIGKSKCLKMRVKSYFSPSPKWDKVKKMILFIHDIEYIVTDTHLEAMLLECELIKKEKPYFNVIMKNDERYVYLKVNERGTTPLCTVYQKVNNCFGPFRSRSRLQNAVDSLCNIYPITMDKRHFVFEYHIFPIPMDKETFKENKEILKKLLNNPKLIKRITKLVEKKMKSAAKEYKFETASMYKNLLDNINYIEYSLNLYSEWLNKTILLDIEIKKGHKLFLIANGCIIHNTKLESITAENKEEFIKAAQTKLEQFPKELNYINLTSKSSIDYHSIIYSEIMKHTIEVIEVERDYT